MERTGEVGRCEGWKQRDGKYTSVKSVFNQENLGLAHLEKPVQLFFGACCFSSWKLQEIVVGKEYG